MKKRYIFAILCLFLLSCGQNIVEKPEKTLSEGEMEELLYDLSMLEAIKNTDYSHIDTLGLSLSTLIYKKYSIDSLILAQNMIYYASLPKKYDTIIKKVEQRLKKERDSIVKKMETPMEVPKSPTE